MTASLPNNSSLSRLPRIRTESIVAYVYWRAVGTQAQKKGHTAFSEECGVTLFFLVQQVIAGHPLAFEHLTQVLHGIELDLPHALPRHADFPADAFEGLAPVAV